MGTDCRPDSRDRDCQIRRWDYSSVNRACPRRPKAEAIEVLLRREIIEDAVARAHDSLRISVCIPDYAGTGSEIDEALACACAGKARIAWEGKTGRRVLKDLALCSGDKGRQIEMRCAFLRLDFGKVRLPAQTEVDAEARTEPNLVGAIQPEIILVHSSAASGFPE